MHMIVGFVLASLLGKKKRAQGALPSIQGKLEVVHALPGRMRLCSPLLENLQDGLGQEINKTLGTVEGIERVSITPQTGSLLIQYDHGRVQAFIVHGVVVKFLGLEAEFEKMPEGRVSRELETIGRALSQQIYQSSGGLFDLRSSFMLSIFSLALYRLVVQGDRTLPNGFNLLWWTAMLAQRGGRS